MPGPTEPEGYGVPNVPKGYVMIPDRPNSPESEALIIAGVDRELEGLGTFLKNLGFRLDVFNQSTDAVKLWWTSEDKKCPALFIKSKPVFMNDEMHLVLDEQTEVSLTKEGEREGWHDTIKDLSITQVAEIKQAINEFYEAQGDAMLNGNTSE